MRWRSPSSVMWPIQRSAVVAGTPEAMHSDVLGQIELETQLRAVVEERRLRVFYQPVIQLTSGKLAAPAGLKIEGHTLWGVYEGYILVGWNGFPRVVVKE